MILLRRLVIIVITLIDHKHGIIVECVCVWVCVDDGWLKQPHLARGRLIGVG